MEDFIFQPLLLKTKRTKTCTMKLIKKLSLLNVALIAAVVFIISSCSSTKQLDKWVDRAIGEVPPFQQKKNIDYLTVKTPLVAANQRASKSVKGKRLFIPAIFYYYEDRTDICNLNPNIAINSFYTSITTAANAKGLKQKLNGGRIELTIDSIPHAFTERSKSWMVFLIVAHFGSQHIFTVPSKESFVVSYKVLKDNVETKRGVITLPNKEKGLSLKFLQFGKKWISDYLGDYQSNIIATGKLFMDKLVAEL